MASQRYFPVVRRVQGQAFAVRDGFHCSLNDFVTFSWRSGQGFETPKPKMNPMVLTCNCSRTKIELKWWTIPSHCASSAKSRISQFFMFSVFQKHLKVTEKAVGKSSFRAASLRRVFTTNFLMTFEVTFVRSAYLVLLQPKSTSLHRLSSRTLAERWPKVSQTLA